MVVVILALFAITGQDDSYDFGSAAGFYVNSTQEPWSKHYHMYDYVTKELPQVRLDIYCCCCCFLDGRERGIIFKRKSLLLVYRLR